MTITAAIILANDSELPFGNSSQTNLPRPGFCASISAAISTIQATPNDKRIPVKIIGIEAGNTIFLMCVKVGKRNTLLTFNKSLSIDETPIDVLITIGHKLHKLTVINDVRNDLETMGSSDTYKALTIMVTSGNHARGETGLNI